MDWQSYPYRLLGDHDGCPRMVDAIRKPADPAPWSTGLGDLLCGDASDAGTRKNGPANEWYIWPYAVGVEAGDNGKAGA
jgi:hypothetical protein